MSDHVDIIIVGGGPAGLTAAIYARRAGKSVLLLERETFGGQIAASPQVENFPGFAAISGAEFSDRLYTQAESLGARIELEEVLSIDCAENGTVKTVTTDYGTHTCSALILATGMKRRTLGLDGEDRFASFCAVCDGAFYAGKDVAVIGGGNTALQDALFLADLCRHVTIIHRRAEFRADPILVEQVAARKNITCLIETTITSLHGEDSLTGLTVRNAVTGEGSELAVDGLFEAVGQLPETRLGQDLGLLETEGFLSAGEDCVTSCPGVFTAGDCRTKAVRQLTTACADGAVAALAACAYCR